MTQQPFFHEESGAVRFWVPIGDELIGASINRQTLRYHFQPHAVEDVPMKTYWAYRQDIHEAVVRRVKKGSREPVMLREYDLLEPLV